MRIRDRMQPGLRGRRARRWFVAALTIGLAAGFCWGPVSAAPPVDKAADDYNMAAWLYASKKYDLAAEEFQSFLKKYPKHEKADDSRLALARSLAHLKQYDEACKGLDGLRQNSPAYDRMPEVLFELGRALGALGRNREAADTFGKVLEKFGDHYLATWACDQRGALLIGLKDHDEAEKTLRPMVERLLTGKNADTHLEEERKRLQHVSPEVAKALDGVLERAHLNLGLAQFAAGRLGPAQGTFEEFLALAPKGPLAETARFHLAQTLFKRDDFTRAADVYKQMAKDGPYAADAAFEGALTLYQAKKYEAATGAFADCAKRFPKADRAGKAILYAGICAYLAEDYAAAAKHLADRAKADPKDAEALYWLGMANLRQSKPAEARDAFRKAAAADPSGPRAAGAAVGQADALLADGCNEEAARAYQAFAAAFADSPDRPRALCAAAAAFNRAGKYAESDAVAEVFFSDPKVRSSDLAPHVLFISGENRFLQKKYVEAAERYADLLRGHETADDAPAARFRLAWIRYFDGKYADAIHLIHQALKADDPPFAADARYLLGTCQFEKGDYSAAFESLSRYLDIAAAGRYRDDAWLKAALARARSNQGDDAVKRLETFLENHASSPLRPHAEYELAELQRAGKQFEPAADHYQAVAKTFPDHDLAPFAWYGLGRCRIEMGNLGEAAAAFGRIPETYPKSELAPQARYQQGLAYEKTGKTAEARAAFETMTQTWPTHELTPAAYLAMGVCLQKEKNYLKAAEAFRNLIAGNPDKKLREQALYELAWSLREAGNAAEALRAYETLAKQFPTSPLAADAYFEAAEARYADQKYPEAIDRYEKALGAAKDDRLKDKILYRLGWCQWAENEWAEAAKLFDRLVAECPQSNLAPEGLFQAAEALIKLGKPADAATRLDKLMDTQYNAFRHLADARFRLAEAQLVLGRNEQAVATLTALEQSNPQYPAMPEAQFNLGRALYNLKQYDAARARFERVTGMTDTETAAKAQFYLGETYLAEQNAREALKAYLRVVALWANYKEWAAAAQFEMGKAYLQLQRPKDARDAFQTVVSKYADTKWAEAAKEQLK